jgi:large subunit ribosomal protein L7Ae
VIDEAVYDDHRRLRPNEVQSSELYSISEKKPTDLSVKLVEVEPMSEAAYEAVELARKTGKIKKGANEVVKAIDRKTAKLVVYAKDVSPPEIAMHIPILWKDQGIPCVEVPSKEELGAAAGLPLGTVAVAIVSEGEAKNLIKELR